MEGIVQIAAFDDLNIANIARLRLESEGIAVALGNVHTLNLLPYNTSAMGRIPLEVSAEQAREALGILVAIPAAHPFLACDPSVIQEIMDAQGDESNDEALEADSFDEDEADSLDEDEWNEALAKEKEKQRLFAFSILISVFSVIFWPILFIAWVINKLLSWVSYDGESQEDRHGVKQDEQLSGEPLPGSKRVAIGYFVQLHEAQFVRDALQDAGVQAFIVNEDDAIEIPSFMAVDSPGIAVEVPLDLAPKAKAALNDLLLTARAEAFADEGWRHTDPADIEAPAGFRDDPSDTNPGASQDER